LSPKSTIESLSDERRLQLLVQAVVDYALFLLNPEGFVVSWKTGARRLKGYDETEILGQHFSRFFTPEDQRRGLPTTVLQTAAKEGRLKAKDGGSARTAPNSGRLPSLMQFAMRTANFSALSKSRAT
jgi:PAS domain-containing protein